MHALSVGTPVWGWRRAVSARVSQLSVWTGFVAVAWDACGAGVDGEGGFVWFEKEERAWALVSCLLLERPSVRLARAEL